MSSRQGQADLLLVCTTLIAAFGWICSREAISGMPVLAFLGLRFALAGVVLLTFCQRAELRQTMRNIRAVLASGLLQAGAMLLWIYGVATTHSLGEGAFIMSLSMLFVPVVAWVILNSRPATSFWISLPVGMAGLALLTLKQGISFEASQLLFLGSALLQAIYFCLNTRYAGTVSVRSLAAVQLCCTGVIASVLSLLLESWPQQITLSTWLWLAASVLIATSLRFWLQLKGQSMTTAASAALIMLLEPLLTVVAAALWYGETMSAQQMSGCALILASLLYYRLQSGRARRRPRNADSDQQD